MKRILIICLAACFLSCKNTDNEANTELIFDREKWNLRDGQDFPYRDRMLGDLMDHDKLKKLNRAQILDLLGEPTRIDTNYFFYRIDEQRIGLLTLHAKTLVVEFAKDSLVGRVMVHQ